MLRPSRRDQLALESLLPLVDREITADPEQRDPARRAARRHEVSRATLCFGNLRVKEEERKDCELRAKLNGVSEQLTCRVVTDVLRSGVAVSPLISSHPVKQPTAPLAVRIEANTRPLHSDHANERHGVPTHGSPLTTIASMSFDHCLPRFLANVPGQILPQSIQQVLDLRRNAHLRQRPFTLRQTADRLLLPPSVEIS